MRGVRAARGRPDQAHSVAGPGLAYAGDARGPLKLRTGKFVIGLVIGGLFGAVLVL